MKTPARKNTITAKVNPTRSAGTPAGSITAIRAELFGIMLISYGCFQPVASTHRWDFPMPPKNGSRVPLRSELCQFLIAFRDENGFGSKQTQRIERTTPPSARKAAPFVADESGLATNATSAATSSGAAKRLRSEVGLAVVKNSFSTA